VKGSTGPQPLRPHTRSNRPIHQSCSSEGGATAGELPFGTMWPIARSTPVFRQGQPRTNKRKCGIQPANQSLITDVFRSRPHLCTIHSRHLQPAWQPEGDQSRAQRLTGDIRVLWPGASPIAVQHSAAIGGGADVPGHIVGLIACQHQDGQSEPACVTVVMPPRAQAGAAADVSATDRKARQDS
jgi:hypothetical protein